MPETDPLETMRLETAPSEAAPSQAAPPPFRPTAHQRAIFAHLDAGRGHAVIRATAGSGKTTTLVQVARRLPEGSSALFLAFGKDAARELAERLGRRVDARTVHSAGHRAASAALRSAGLRLRLDDGKYRALVRARLEGAALPRSAREEERAEAEAFATRLAQLARLDLADAADPAALEALAERYDLDRPERRALERAALDVVPLALADGARLALEGGALDFTDLLHLPWTLHGERPAWRPRGFDLVCVDEAQDYSALALEFTTLLVRPGGRLLFVGDPRQAIFGFAGADPEALERIVTRTRAEVLPLSVTWRCPTAHVRLAQRLAPEMRAAPGAREGRVAVIDPPELPAWAEPGALVLARTNAPLVRACLELVRAGRRAHVRGRDLGADLRSLLRAALGPGDLAHPLGRLESYRMRETERLLRRGGDPDAAWRRVARLDDAVEAALALIEHLEVRDRARSGTRNGAGGGARGGGVRLSDLEALVDDVLAEREDAVGLSTIHRAKGREAERVILLRPDLLPAPGATGPRAARGEACVMFVALTRARRDLVIVRPQDEEGGAGAARGAEERAGERAQVAATWREVLQEAEAASRASGDPVP